jgi:opacity protein-like surface antigen
MNRALSRITLALTLGGSLIGALMSPALADGDPYYSNGINQSGVRTPIPAPIPVPVEEAFWYLRADFAAGFGSTPSVSVLGTNYADLVAGSVQSDSFEPSFTGGGGIGYVWGPYFRTDLTVDVHSIMNTEFTGSTTDFSVTDKTKFMSTILLANAYYDIRTGTAWSPYLGLGVGFAVNQVTRNLNYSDGITDTVVIAGNRTTDVQFAGAAMVGVTYDISTLWALDVNYRFLHIGGSEVSLKPDAPSSLAIGDLNEHQIRAGLRFLVN